MPRKKAQGKSVLGTAGKAALGLTAAAAAAYGAYLWGAPGRRRPATELGYALNLRLHYSAWRGLHYAYYSRPGTGRPIAILHSVNAVASAHEMRPLVQRLQRETQRPLYALEWIGFGHSDRPEISYSPDLLEDQLEHFLARVVRASDGADVIGLSLGATYAAEVARRRPDLVHSLVAIEPAGLGEEPQEIGNAWAKLLFTLPGVQRAFYDRLTKPDALYAICLDWPVGEAHITALSSNSEVPAERIAQVRLLGHPGALDWRQDAEGLHIRTPDQKPGNHAYTFKITLRA